jgi:hypothetical protein
LQAPLFGSKENERQSIGVIDGIHIIPFLAAKNCCMWLDITTKLPAIQHSEGVVASQYRPREKEPVGSGAQLNNLASLICVDTHERPAIELNAIVIDRARRRILYDQGIPQTQFLPQALDIGTDGNRTNRRPRNNFE